MIPVSEEWRNKIKEQFRRQGYLKITVVVVPPGLPDKAEASSSSTDPRATTENLVFRSPKVPEAIASFEPNRWVLDGSFKLLKSSQDNIPSWWSRPTGSGVLSFVLDQEYSIPGLTVYWDEVTGTAPVSLTVTGYNSKGQQVARYDLEQPFEPVSSLEVPMEGVSKVVLYINQWRHSSLWRARVSAVIFGLYASYDSINQGLLLSGETTDSADPLNNSLPTHTASVRLRNINGEFDPTLQQGISKYLAQRQLVQLQWGFTVAPEKIEWSPRLNYYLNSFSIPADSKEITLEATSRLAFLTQEYKTSQQLERSYARDLRTLTLEVLRSSKIIRESEDEEPWSVSSRMSEYKTRAPLPIMAANALLQLLASASCCWLTTDPTTGSICITDSTSEANASVDLAQQIGDPAIELQEPLRSISIGVYTYSPASERSEISKGTYTLSGFQTLTLNYNTSYAVDVEVSVSTDSKYNIRGFRAYDSCATLELWVEEDDSAVVITLTGREVKQSVTYVQTYQNSSVSQGLEVVVENPLITDNSRVNDLSDWILSWYNRRQLLKVPYLGYPEVVASDPCWIRTTYTDGKSATVLSNKITFNGAFSGSLEVK